MAFDIDGDSDGIIKIKPGPQPVKSGVVPVAPQVKVSGNVNNVEPEHFILDEIKGKVKVPKDFPPKPFKLSDYGL